MNNTRKIGSTAISIALVLAGAMHPADAEAQERYSLAGEEVAIYNLAGEVRVEAGEGSEMVVDVARDGPDAGELRVETGRIDGRQTLRVVYPGDQVVYREQGGGSRTTVSVRRDGTFGGGMSERQVRIQGSGDGTEAHADLTVRLPAGKRFALYLAVGEVEVENVDGDLLIDTHSAPVTTAATRGALSIDVGSGAVQVRDAQGDVEVDTGSGSVSLSGVRGARLLVDTGSGAVSGSGVEADDLRVDTGSGRVELAAVRARNGRVDTGSGGVELDLIAPATSLEIDTGSGGVRLTVPSTLGADIEIDTGSGGIDIDLPVTTMRTSRSYFRGTIGDGEGRIHIDTGSGGVRIRER